MYTMSTIAFLALILVLALVCGVLAVAAIHSSLVALSIMFLAMTGANVYLAGLVFTSETT